MAEQLSPRESKGWDGIPTLGLSSSLEGVAVPRVQFSQTVLEEGLRLDSRRLGRRSERGADVQWRILQRCLVESSNDSTPLGSPKDDTSVFFTSRSNLRVLKHLEE